MKTNNRRFSVDADIDYQMVKQLSEYYTTEVELDNDKLAVEVERKIRNEVESLFRYDHDGEIEEIIITNLKYTITVEAEVNFDEVEEDTVNISEIIELPFDTNEEEIEEELNNIVLDKFYEDVNENYVIDEPIVDLVWEEIPPISPMKVMELEGEKGLFSEPHGYVV